MKELINGTGIYSIAQFICSDYCIDQLECEAKVGIDELPVIVEMLGFDKAKIELFVHFSQWTKIDYCDDDNEDNEDKGLVPLFDIKICRRDNKFHLEFMAETKGLLRYGLFGIESVTDVFSPDKDSPVSRYKSSLEQEAQTLSRETGYYCSTFCNTDGKDDEDISDEIFGDDYDVEEDGKTQTINLFFSFSFHSIQKN